MSGVLSRKLTIEWWILKTLGMDPSLDEYAKHKEQKMKKKKKKEYIPQKTTENLLPYWRTSLSGFGFASDHKRLYKDITIP